MRSYDGSVQQSAHQYNESDYGDERLYYPVLGIILSVKSPDDASNKSNVKNSDQLGSRIECNVLVTNGGRASNWTVNNAPLMPMGACGIDNFHEETPRPCTQMINGAKFTGDLSNIDYNLLDGDRCLVSFIGGKISQPVITHWFPHPGNTFDPATGGFAEGALTQLPRLFKRYNGVKYTITNKGNVYFDTTDAGSITTTINGQYVRKRTDVGGNVNIDMKENATLIIDFNPTVPVPVSEPSLRQANGPSAPKIEGERDEFLSNFYMDSDEIAVFGGETVKIGAEKSVDISALSIKLGTNLETVEDADDQLVINASTTKILSETANIIATTSAELNSPNVRLGTNPADAIIKGTAYVAHESSFLDALDLFTTALDTFAQGTLAPPPIKAAFAGAANAFKLTIAVFKTQINSDLSTEVTTT